MCAKSFRLGAPGPDLRQGLLEGTGLAVLCAESPNHGSDAERIWRGGPARRYLGGEVRGPRVACVCANLRPRPSAPQLSACCAGGGTLRERRCRMPLFPPRWPGGAARGATCANGVRGQAPQVEALLRRNATGSTLLAMTRRRGARRNSGSTSHCR